ncbi:MAG: hypothetical protein AAF614_05460 [Chloroflexota bacterium]
MDTQLQAFIEAIHQSPYRLVFVTAGAGSQALSHLLGVAGASETLLEAVVPYSFASFNDFLGYVPQKYVSPKAANLLAGRALTRARWLEDEERPVLGIACTATIATTRPKKGEHRAHIAVWQPEKVTCYSLYLHKGRRDRAGEEDAVSRVILNGLAEACGLAERLDIHWYKRDRLEIKVHDLETAVHQLLDHTVPYLGIYPDGRIRSSNINPQILLSGSFNPLHDGHIQMAKAASELLNKPVAFEIPAINADKPALAAASVVNRVAQFAGRYPVYITRAPNFIHKARLFPNTVFVIGFDTATRILQPRFYGNTLEQRDAALAELRELNCSLLVAGRVDDDGVFHDCSELPVPLEYKSLFQGIPDSIFRLDISSTKLRQTGQKGSR